MDISFKVPVTTILEIHPHPNAERLSLAVVYGFQVVIPNNTYQVGEKVVYIPVDSILSNEVENRLFGPDAKIKLTKSRVRQIRIRKFPSQGMICKLETLGINFATKEETDVSMILGITKYEPEIKEQNLPKGKNGRKNLAHQQFHSYNGLGNIKWFPRLFRLGEEVVIQEKLHGTNARAAKLPYRINSFWRLVKYVLGLAPKSEFLYGSNRVDITNSESYSGFYGTDVYGSVFKKMNVKDKIKDNETIFGEIIGMGIQNNYNYGHEDHTFVLFDVKILNPDGTQTWLGPEEVEKYAKDRGFAFVPVLYKGPYTPELVDLYVSGSSVYCPKEKVKEGIVIKSVKDYSIEGNKKALKCINPEYLDDHTNSDEH